jgi:glutamyl/glutaminyl-tRNA synthetase
LAEDKAFYDDEKVLRLKYPIGEVVVRDLVCGDCVFNMQSLGGEPALLRSDGTPTYHIASVLDDVEMDITHIIRGQDHLTNTAKHQVLFEALGGKVPAFAHLPLILGENGAKMSKRTTEGLTTVSEFRNAGYPSEALNNFLSLLGWSHPEELETLSFDELFKSFDLKRVNQTAAKFEFQKLDFLSGWWIRHLPIERVAQEARAFVGEYLDLIDARGPEFWPMVVDGLRGKLTTLADISSFGPLLFSMDPEVADDAKERFGGADTKAAFLSVAGRWNELLAEVPLEDDRDCYTVEQFKTMTKVLKKELDVDAKTVFQGVRVLVTGTLSGPDLQVLASSIQRSVLQERARSIMAAFA